LLFLLPVLPAGQHFDLEVLPAGSGNNHPWPADYLVAPQLLDLLRFYLVVGSIAWGFVASLLVAKLLYAGPLATLARQSRGRNRRGPLRALLALRHCPFMIAAIMMISQVWRVRDLTAHTLRLQQGHATS
jgi:hypothetical protein